MSSQSNKKVLQKPESLKLISWFLIVLSVFNILRFGPAQLSIIVTSIVQLDPGAEGFFIDLVDILSIAILIAYYILLLVSSIHLLQLNQWALDTVEILTWIYLIYSSILIVLTLLPIGNLSLAIFEMAPEGKEGESIRSSMRTIILLSRGLGIIISVAILFGLNGKSIKSVFSQTEPNSI
jgi:hypothetical protein